MRSLICGLGLVALTACSSAEVGDTLHADATPENLSIQTASYFETSRSRVAIGNLQPGMFGTSYYAKVAGRAYDCHYFKKTVSCSRA